MDFLRIRQKAKERAQTCEREATPPAGELAPERVQRIEDALREELAALVVTTLEAPPAALGSRAPADDDPLDDFFWREDEVAPSLPVLVAAAPSRAAAEIAGARREWLTFVLGGEEYAVEIGHVREILKA